MSDYENEKTFSSMYLNDVYPLTEQPSLEPVAEPGKLEGLCMKRDPETQDACQLNAGHTGRHKSKLEGRTEPMKRHVCGNPYFADGERRFCEKDGDHEEMTCGPVTPQPQEGGTDRRTCGCVGEIGCFICDIRGQKPRATKPSLSPEIASIDFSKVTYFIQNPNTGRLVESTDPYRRDYVSYQDFCVLRDALEGKS